MDRVLLLMLASTLCTVNAAAPRFDTPPSNGGSGSIAENTAVGSVIITLQATDTDGDTLTFTVASQTPVNPAFTINRNDELTVPSGLDSETTKSFTLMLRVTDGTTTVNTTYTLTIIDDASPVFSQNRYTATIFTPASPGTTVATVTATDADSSSFTYQIQGAQTTFAISAAGVITVSDPSDLSFLGGSVTLHIQADDGTNTPGTATVQITIREHVPVHCHSGWMTHGQKCYHFSHDIQQWRMARLICQDFGGDLAEVHNADVDQFLINEIKRLHGSFWLGGNDIEEEGIWEWANSRTHFGYLNWVDGEPNNVASLENCMVLDPIGWLDLPCVKQRHYICEFVPSAHGPVIG